MNSGDAVRILFLEDAPKNMELAKRGINGEQFDCMRVNTEPAFLKALESYTPDLIISEYFMQSFDGMKALDISKKRDKNLPFIMLASIKNESDAVACMKAGADDYVVEDHLPRLPFAISEALAKSKERYEKEKDIQLLCESEEKYRIIFNDSAAIIILFNSETLTIVDANASAACYFGSPREELIGKNIMEFYVFDELIIRNFVGKILLSDKQHFSFRDRRSDGRLRDVDAFAGKLMLHAKSFIYLLVYDITEKMRNENRLRDLAVQLTKIEERERKNLALYLHDETSQKLAFLKMKIEALSRIPEVNFPEHDLEQIFDLLNQMILNTQSMVMDLCPAILYKLGLTKGLKSEGEDICKKAGLKFIFFDRGSQVSLDDNKKILIFRCVQELMRNIVKHAKASEMALSIQMVGNLLEIELCDDGVGFDPSALETQAAHQGFGLFSVQERISGIKGNVRINSKIGIGTRITLAILAN